MGVYFMNYYQQLKHANWQRKRAEIFERDNFKCRVCQSEMELQAHHLYYLPDTFIWDYDMEAYLTVCKDHHEILNKELPKLAGIIALKILTGTDIIDFKKNSDGR